MTVKRQRLLAAPDDSDARRAVASGARFAGVLRGALGLTTLAIVLLGARLLDLLA